MSLNLTIKMPLKTPIKKPQQVAPATDCYEPTGPFLAVSRYYDETHKLLVMAINCLAAEDEAERRNPGGLPEGTVILNGGG